MRYASRYTEHEAQQFLDRYGEQWGEELALRVYTSRLLGRDPTLVLHGGGNTSVKGRAEELSGEETDVLWVKGSGWDLQHIAPPGFPACRLEPLLRYCQLPAMTDEQMVQGLRSQMLDPASPTPSVEALLHAFIPGKYVDHTHSNAVLSVVNQPDGASHAQEVWGDEMVFVPYVMPGFILARRIVELGRELQGRRLMVLDKHGIFTWGETARESYELMLEAVAKAHSFVEKSVAGQRNWSIPGEPSDEQRARRQSELSPILRGALARAEEGQRCCLEWRSERSILALLERPDARELTSVGTMTPDHVIRTKPIPAWLGPLREARGVEKAKPIIEDELTRYSDWYRSYFERGVSTRKRELTRLDALPRLLLVPGLGVVSAAKGLKEARIAGDIYAHTSQVILDTVAQSGYRPVSELDLFDMEYWSLEQAKLQRGKGGGGALERRIALVTGAASGIGQATAAHLLEQGAHVLLADNREAPLTEAEAVLREKHGLRVAARACDVTDADQVEALLRHAAHCFGGLDIIVSNAGNAPTGQLHESAGSAALDASLRLNLLSHQLVAKSAVEVLLPQGLGGCLLFNASKSAFNQGPDFGPYAVPKAALVALMKQYAVDLGFHGIRSNAVNADRIRTDLFGSGVLEKRAAARKVSPEEYFRLNLLQRETTAADVAYAFGWLCSAEATTGCVITVDGGNPAAFPR